MAAALRPRQEEDSRLLACRRVDSCGILVRLGEFPQQRCCAAALVAGFVILTQLCMWWPSRDWGALGTTLVGGAVVSLSIFLLQNSFEAEQELARQQELRQVKAARRREDLLLTLGLQQNLTGIDLSGKNLSDVYLAGKILKDADLSSAKLQNATLLEADLTDADLSQARFRGADVSYADFRRARLWDAKLIFADLTYADLRGADLAGANLKGATLHSTDLRWVDGLGKGNLSFVEANFETRWPKGFEPRKHHILFNETCTKTAAGYCVAPPGFDRSTGEFTGENPFD